MSGGSRRRANSLGDQVSLVDGRLSPRGHTFRGKISHVPMPIVPVIQSSSVNNNNKLGLYSANQFQAVEVLLIVKHFFVLIWKAPMHEPRVTFILTEFTPSQV